MNQLNIPKRPSSRKPTIYAKHELLTQAKDANFTNAIRKLAERGVGLVHILAPLHIVRTITTTHVPTLVTSLTHPTSTPMRLSTQPSPVCAFKISATAHRTFTACCWSNVLMGRYFPVLSSVNFPSKVYTSRLRSQRRCLGCRSLLTLPVV